MEKGKKRSKKLLCKEGSVKEREREKQVIIGRGQIDVGELPN